MGGHMNDVTSSGLKTADAVIHARTALLYGVSLIPAAAASTVVIYDNPSAASGTVVAKLSALANGESVYIAFDNPVAAQDGLYADLTGAAAEYIVYYAPL